MPSPFPGMDPYLEDEKLWPAFQHALVAALYQALLPNLVDRYRARVGQRHYVTEQALFTSVIREEHHEEFVEVRQRNDGRDAVLDLQTTFARCYDQGAFCGKIDYGRDPATALADDDRKWLNDWLKQQKLR